MDGLSRSYDNNGNLLDDGESTYNWNIRNKLESSGDMSYTYDHSGSRVKSTNAATGEETVYINQYMELRDGEPVYYIFAGGTRVASLEDDNSGTGTLEITYLHQDHLGGTALATDSDGLVVQLYDYYPFGTQLEDASYGDSPVEVSHSFTDKEFEEELDLYYFEARWYDSEIGKFGSMDPAVLDDRVFEMLQDPQSFNAYAYSRNNPVVLVDPDGENPYVVVFELVFETVKIIFGDIPSAGEGSDGEFSPNTSDTEWVDNVVIDQAVRHSPWYIKYPIKGAEYIYDQVFGDDNSSNGVFDSESSEYIYTIQSGDTLYELFGENYEEVVDYNGIENSDLIYEGQEIRIPVETKTES